MITIYMLRCCDAAAQDPRLFRLLSPDEQAHVGRLRQAADRQRSVLGRAAARVIIGRALDRPPATVTFRPGPYGKPELDSRHRPIVHFNIAHSLDRILLALADSPVGVDVEHVQEDVDHSWLQASFTEREHAHIVSARAAIAHWTAKEAVLKACGRGLSLDPACFEVLGGGARWTEVSGPSVPDELKGLRVAGLFADGPYCGAISTADRSAGWRLIPQAVKDLLSDFT